MNRSALGNVADWVPISPADLTSCKSGKHVCKFVQQLPHSINILKEDKERELDKSVEMCGNLAVKWEKAF